MIVVDTSAVVIGIVEWTRLIDVEAAETIVVASAHSSASLFDGHHPKDGPESVDEETIASSVQEEATPQCEAEGDHPIVWVLHPVD